MTLLKILIWFAAVGGLAALSGLPRRFIAAAGGKTTLPSWSPAVAGLAVAAGASLLFLFSSVGFIEAGTRGVVLRFGAPTGRVLGEGLYVITPLAEGIAKMNVQTQAYEAEADAASNDLQDVHTKVTLNYSLDPEQVVNVYRTLRYDYVSRIIKPAIQESVKASTAKFRAEALITHREQAKEAIEKSLRQRLGTHGIAVDTISITDFDFSKEFNAAIEAKVTAAQQALKAERDLERIKLEAQQQIEQAKAQAESLRLQKTNVTVELVALRRIEAQLKWIEKWDGKVPSVVTPGLVPMFEVGK